MSSLMGNLHIPTATDTVRGTELIVSGVLVKFLIGEN